MIERLTAGDSISEREIGPSSVLDTPRERVFTAFGDPTHLVHWWGWDGLPPLLSAGKRSALKP
jgi:uncharacterized protein YndB with AHSA1/START domain